jgi:hypothetical protein
MFNVRDPLAEALAPDLAEWRGTTVTEVVITTPYVRLECPLAVRQNAGR